MTAIHSSAIHVSSLIAVSRDYCNDPAFHELVDSLVLAVANGNLPDIEFVRDAADLAELLLSDIERGSGGQPQPGDDAS